MMAEWRECVFAREQLPDWATRDCDLVSQMRPSSRVLAVHRNWCAACPVPLLVEAVEDAREGCLLRGDKERCPTLWEALECPTQWCDPAKCKLHTALAALPKEPTSD